MTLYDWKAFYRWLEAASEEELVQKRNALKLAIKTKKLTERSTIKEARHLICQIELEMLDRGFKTEK